MFKKWFKPSPLKETLKALRKNNLGPQADLLRYADRINGYTLRSQVGDDSTFQEKAMEEEMTNLAKQSVDLIAARNSMKRFQSAVVICEEFGFEKGARFLSMYVKLYDEFSRRGHLMPDYFK